jgi:hypothetical protein
VDGTEASVVSREAPGVSTVLYTVTDAAGNATEFVRTIVSDYSPDQRRDQAAAGQPE